MFLSYLSDLSQVSIGIYWYIGWCDIVQLVGIYWSIGWYQLVYWLVSIDLISSCSFSRYTYSGKGILRCVLTRDFEVLDIYDRKTNRIFVMKREF